MVFNNLYNRNAIDILEHRIDIENMITYIRELSYTYPEFTYALRGTENIKYLIELYFQIMEGKLQSIFKIWRAEEFHKSIQYSTKELLDALEEYNIEWNRNIKDKE